MPTHPTLPATAPDAGGAAAPDLLECRDLSLHFGGVAALDQVNLRLNQGEIIGLIGPNGAGKTTLVNTVTGILKPTRGEILFQGKRIDALRPDQIAGRGISRTFQIVQPFARQTVLDNVAAAALFAGGIHSISQSRAVAREHLQFCGLQHVADQIAGTLPLAGRKRLELAKSLAMNPKLLFLDEVNAGLNAREADLAQQLIRDIAGHGITIVLIEHLMKVVLKASTRIVVLNRGRLIADGSPDDVVANPDVIEAYLGHGHARKAREAA